MTPRDLFTVPPEEFVAARNQLVKALKAAGDRDQAAVVGGWRRPSAVDWSLNVVARDHEDDVAEYLAAADAARAAQAAAIEGRPGDDLRAAVGGLRDATARLVRRAEGVLDGQGKASSVSAPTITGRLAEVATNADLGEQLRERRLGSGPVESSQLFAGLEPAARPTKRPPPSPPPARRQATTPPRRPRTEESAARALTTAERARSSAQAAADRAGAAVARAEADVAALDERLAAAKRTLVAKAEEHDRLERAAEDAARAVEALRSG